jgi:predicted DNA-binding ribbon-helix-helix protein
MERSMRRTQIYLPDALYETLKSRAQSRRVSISELIRRSLEKDVQQDPVADAHAFFEQLKPLESFAEVDPDAYVRAIRSKSRIPQNSDET